MDDFGWIDAVAGGSGLGGVELFLSTYPSALAKPVSASIEIVGWGWGIPAMVGEAATKNAHCMFNFADAVG